MLFRLLLDLLSSCSIMLGVEFHIGWEVSVKRAFAKVEPFPALVVLEGNEDPTTKVIAPHQMIEDHKIVVFQSIFYLLTFLVD